MSEEKLKDHVSRYLMNGDEQLNDNDEDSVGSDDSSGSERSGYVLLSQGISDDEREGNQNSDPNLDTIRTESHLNIRNETPEQGIGLRLLLPQPPVPMEKCMYIIIPISSFPYLGSWE